MTTVKLSPFDAADHLPAERDVASVEAVLEDGDTADFIESLGVVARSKGMAELAKAAGVTRTSLYKSLSASGKPEFATVKSVLASMGLALHIAPAISPAAKGRPAGLGIETSPAR